MKEFLREHTPGLFNFLKHVKNLILYSSEGCPLVFNFRNYSTNKFFRKIIKFLVTPFMIIKYFFPVKNLKREGLAIVLIAKNEAQYIMEWINFHVKQGASHFFIYDNESTDNLYETLQPFIKRGLVTYKKFPGKIRQNDAYNHAIYHYKRKFKYFAMIDADEFLFVRNNTQGGGGLYKFLDSFMSEHPNAGGIGVNWLVFGSNGHDTKPDGGVLKNFIMCVQKDFDANHHIKTICDPMKIFSWINPHFPMQCRGFHNLSENGEIIDGPFTRKVSFDKIRINHYFYKSREEYTQKIARGRADVDQRSIADFRGHKCNIITDTEILSHI